jgi:hypothetical protein
VNDVNDATGQTDQPDEPDFIVPPPGLVPSAPAEAPATTRRPRSRPVERSLPSFTPASASIAVPVAGATGADATSAPASAPAPGWRLIGDGSVELVIAGPTLLGRAPDVAASPVTGAQPVAVNDPARTVSKTHAFAEPGDGALLVTDLRSTNGVRVERTGAAPIEVPRGSTIAVAEGQLLVLGEFRLLVTRL